MLVRSHKGNAMFSSESSGRVISGIFLLGAAAGCGWLLYTQARKSPAVADGARHLARTLRDGLTDVGELTAGAGERLRNSTRSAASRITSRANAVLEPMAGDGA
jgi:hypothetical protein